MAGEVLQNEILLPREKLLFNGPQSLSTEELLAILIRTGAKDINVMEVSRLLYNSHYNSLYSLRQSTLEKINSVKGMGNVKAITIMAALELGVRFYKEITSTRKKIKSPFDIFDACRDMVFLETEVVRTVCLDSKSNILNVENTTSGISNASLIHPREIFRKAIVCSSVSVAVVHNHPSGDPTPSSQDREVTEKLIEAGELLGIKLIDHIIIGKGCYYSFTLEKEFRGGELSYGEKSGSGKIAETESCN